MLVQEDHLRHITHLFYRGNYSQGITQISTFIQQNPGNSNLYTNRALFLAQLDNDQEALKDLRLALSINPRNYISYFNIFSIRIKQGLEQEAYQQLCCSISCLLLLKAKQNKNLNDINRSIYFSGNNFESHLLKGLILMELGNHLQAFYSFQAALNYNPLNKIILHLRRVAFAKIQPETKSNLMIKQQFPVNLNDDWRDFTLKCTIPLPKDEQLYDKIEQRLKQFNRLYNEININIGAVTHKIPNQATGNQVIESKHSHEEHVIIIRDSGVRTPKNQSQLYPEPGNVYVRVSRTEHQSLQGIVKKQELQFQSIVNSEQKDEYFKEQHHFSSVIQYTEPLPQKDQREADEFQDIVHQNNDYLQPSKMTEKLESFSSLQSINHQQIIQPYIPDLQSFQQIKQTQKYNIIYPLDDNMKLKIKVLNLSFEQFSSSLSSSSFSSSFQNLSKLTNLYCIISYNSGKTKLKTQSKPYKDGQCTWNHQFSPIKIAQLPSDMLIKLYNKRYNSIRDEFLGDLEVLITTADKLLLPLHNKKGECLGQLLIQLELVESRQVKEVEVVEV